MSTTDPRVKPAEYGGGDPLAAARVTGPLTEHEAQVAAAVSEAVAQQIADERRDCWNSSYIGRHRVAAYGTSVKDTPERMRYQPRHDAGNCGQIVAGSRFKQVAQ